MKRFDVVGVGQASIDLLGVVAGYPPPDVKAELLDWQEQGGGPVATALVALQRLGRRTAFLGKVGDDAYGRAIVAGLQAEGVDTTGVVVAPGLASQFAFIAVERGSGRRTIFWTRGSAFPLRPAEAALELVEQGRFLHLDGLHLEVSLEAARRARAASVPVMLDTGTWRPETADLLPFIDYLVVGEGFVRGLTGRAERADWLAALRQWGARLVGVTHGPAGATIWTDGVMYHQPAFAIEAVDTTGCGDAFHGALIHGLLEGWAPPRLLRFAAAVAALKCRRLGGRAGLPTLAEVETFLRFQPSV